MAIRLIKQAFAPLKNDCYRIIERVDGKQTVFDITKEECIAIGLTEMVSDIKDYLKAGEEELNAE